MGWNSVLKDLMGLPHSTEILPMFENQQILCPVIIPKITSNIVFYIRECKRIFWEDFIVFMQNLVSKRREKERQLYHRFINSIDLTKFVHNNSKILSKMLINGTSLWSLRKLINVFKLTELTLNIYYGPLLHGVR